LVSISSLDFSFVLSFLLLITSKLGIIYIYIR
jgi:hypothetical protein